MNVDVADTTERTTNEANGMLETRRKTTDNTETNITMATTVKEGM